MLALINASTQHQFGFHFTTVGHFSTAGYIVIPCLLFDQDAIRGHGFDRGGRGGNFQNRWRFFSPPGSYGQGGHREEGGKFVCFPFIADVSLSLSCLVVRVCVRHM